MAHVLMLMDGSRWNQHLATPFHSSCANRSCCGWSAAAGASCEPWLQLANGWWHVQGFPAENATNLDARIPEM